MSRSRFTQQIVPPVAAKPKPPLRSSPKDPLAPPRMIIPSVLLVKSDGSQGSKTADGKAQPILTGLLEKSGPPPNTTSTASAPLRPSGAQPLAAPRMSSSLLVRATPRGRPPKQISIPSVSQLEKVITDSIQRGVDVSPKNFPSFTPLNSEGATSSSSVQTYVGALTDQVASFMKEIPEGISPPPDAPSAESDITLDDSIDGQSAECGVENLPAVVTRGADEEITRRRLVAPTSAAVLVLPKPPDIASDPRSPSNYQHSILLQGRLVTADTSGKLLSSAPFTRTIESFNNPDERMEVEGMDSVELLEVETSADASSVLSSVSTMVGLESTATDTLSEATLDTLGATADLRSENTIPGAADLKRRQSRKTAVARNLEEEEEEPPPRYEDLTKEDEPGVFIDLTKPELLKAQDSVLGASPATRDDCPMPRRTPLPIAKSSTIKATPLCRSSLRPNIRAQKKPLLISKSRTTLKPTPVVSRAVTELVHVDTDSKDKINAEIDMPTPATPSQKSSSGTRRPSVPDICDPDIEEAGNRLLESPESETEASGTPMVVTEQCRHRESSSSCVASETRTASRRRVSKPSRRSSASKIIARRASSADAGAPPLGKEASRVPSPPGGEIPRPSTSRSLRASTIKPSISLNVPKKQSSSRSREKVESSLPVVDPTPSAGRPNLSSDDNHEAEDEVRSSPSDLVCLGSVVILPKNLQCSQCPYKTHTQKFLDLHVKNHKMVPCVLCNRTFADEASLREHKQADHSQSSTEELYECPKCDYKTRHQVYISRHITLKHAVD